MNTIKFDSKEVKVVAHKGVSSIERENTCPAFVAAGNRSYYGVETDVHTTADGKFVVIHDETTDRVSLGQHSINVEENDYSAIENIVLPDLDETTYRQDIRIPLLSEYIQICKRYKKICVLELKNHFEKDDIARMIEEIKQVGYIEGVIFISFDLENCINIRNFLPQNEVQLLLNNEDITSEVIKTLLDNKLDLDIYYKKLNKENIKLLHSNGIKINCWTCDDKDEAETLAKLGVDYITTNILE